MKIVFAVKNDSRQKAEDLLKQDNEISRGSIVLRSASSLDIDEDCYFILLDAGEHAVEKARHLLEGIAEVYKQGEKIIEKIKKQEDAATEGFGSILG